MRILLLLLALVLSANANAKPSDSLWPAIHAGWPSSLEPLRRRLDPAKSYVTWLIKLPLAPMDMRSPELFRRSILPVFNLQNLAKNDMTISHMMLAWQCSTDDGKTLRGATGQTGEQDDQMIDAFLAGWGQSTLFATYHDGHLQTPGEIETVIRKAHESGFPLAHVTFEVDANQCRDMLAFLRAYIDHRNRPMTKFGAGEPLKFEGGGCGSFASAMLSHARVMPELHPALWRSFRGSLRLMGYRAQPPARTTFEELPPEVARAGRYVHFNTLLASFWDQEDGPVIRAVDPELAIFALRTLGARARPDERDASWAAFQKRVIHSVLPYVDPEPRHDYFPIEANLDPHYGRVARIARAATRAYPRLSTATVGPYSGFVLEK